MIRGRSHRRAERSIVRIVGVGVSGVGVTEALNGEGQLGVDPARWL